MIKQWLLKFARNERGAMWIDWSSKIPSKYNVCGGVVFPCMECWVLLGKILHCEIGPLGSKEMKYKNPVDFVMYQSRHKNGESTPKDLKGQALKDIQGQLSKNRLAEQGATNDDAE